MSGRIDKHEHVGTVTLDRPKRVTRLIARIGMRNDRRSAIDSFDMSFDAAMEHEFALGVATIASGDISEGAGRFVEGQGCHGAF